MNDDLTECKLCSEKTKSPKWRKDFPIEWEGDHYVSRREMVKFLTLGSLLLAVANWGTAFASGLLRRASNQEQWIGSAAKLEQTGSLLFRYPTDQDPCIAVQTPVGKLVAYSQICTHLSCAVIYDNKQNALLCPCHKGAFDVEEGRPTAGPPIRPLSKVNVVKRGDQLFAISREA